MGYETNGQGEFKDGLSIEGEINLDTSFLDIGGKEWRVNFYNLSSIYVWTFDNNDNRLEYIYETSNVSIIPIINDPISYLTMDRISNISKFASASFQKDDLYIQLNPSSVDPINGTRESDDEDEYISLSGVIISTGITNINLENRGGIKLFSDSSNTQFNILKGNNCTIETYRDKFLSEQIDLEGELFANNFQGNIRSNGKCYFFSDLRMSGDIRINILRDPDYSVSIRDTKTYYWILDIEGKDVETEGSSLPFWTIGLIISVIPSIILLAYHFNKTKTKGKDKTQKVMSH